MCRNWLILSRSYSIISKTFKVPSLNSTHTSPRHMLTSTYHSSLACSVPTYEGKSCFGRAQDPIPASFFTVFLTFPMCLSCGQVYTLFSYLQSGEAHCPMLQYQQEAHAASLISSINQLSGLCENLYPVCVGLQRRNRWEESISATRKRRAHKFSRSWWVMWSEKGHSILYKHMALDECCSG